MAAQPDWVSIIVAALGALGALGAGGWATLRWWIERRDRKQALETIKSWPSDLAKSAEIDAALMELMLAVQASQALLLRAQNGGKVPEPGGDYTSSVTNEAYERAELSVKARWQSQPLSDFYLSVLLQVYNEGQVKIWPRKMPDVPLRAIYRKNGVYKSRVIGVRQEVGACFYISVVWTRPPSISTPEIDDEVRVTTHKIQEILDARNAMGVPI